MRHFVLILFFSVLLIRSKGQVNIGGTYLIGAVCKDGIVLAADTRVVIFVNKDTLCYYDTTAKIFITKWGAMAVAKIGIVNNLTIKWYVDEYNKSKYSAKNDGETIGSFFEFILSTYPAAYTEFLRAKIITMGFMDKLPFVCSYSSFDHAVRCGDTTSIALDSLSGFHKIYNRKYTCQQMGKLIEKTIKNYVIKYHKQRDVGGPIMLLKIFPSGETEWLNNPKKNREPENIIDIMRDYKNNKLNIHFLDSTAKKRFDNYFNVSQY